MWVRVEAENREESCVVFVSGVSAKGFFVPLVTVQDKHCKCRFEGKAGRAWTVWNASAGSDMWALTPPRLRSFAQAHGDGAIVRALQS